jgi:transposase
MEWLPPYAPDLNPIELLWDWLDDTALANVTIEHQRQLRGRLRAAIQRRRKKPSIGRGFLKHRGLF